jgi:hypothetical protein
VKLPLCNRPSSQQVELEVGNNKGENKLGGRVGERKGNKTRGFNRRHESCGNEREVYFHSEVSMKAFGSGQGGGLCVWVTMNSRREETDPPNVKMRSWEEGVVREVGDRKQPFGLCNRRGDGEQERGGR